MLHQLDRSIMRLMLLLESKIFFLYETIDPRKDMSVKQWIAWSKYAGIQPAGKTESRFELMT